MGAEGRAGVVAAAIAPDARPPLPVCTGLLTHMSSSALVTSWSFTSCCSLLNTFFLSHPRATSATARTATESSASAESQISCSLAYTRPTSCFAAGLSASNLKAMAPRRTKKRASVPAAPARGTARAHTVLPRAPLSWWRCCCYWRWPMIARHRRSRGLASPQARNNKESTPERRSSAWASPSTHAPPFARCRCLTGRGEAGLGAHCSRSADIICAHACTLVLSFSSTSPPPVSSLLTPHAARAVEGMRPRPPSKLRSAAHSWQDGGSAAPEHGGPARAVLQRVAGLC